jgi:hypothetical protein
VSSSLLQEQTKWVHPANEYPEGLRAKMDPGSTTSFPHVFGGNPEKGSVTKQCLLRSARYRRVRYHLGKADQEMGKGLEDKTDREKQSGLERSLRHDLYLHWIPARSMRE